MTAMLAPVLTLRSSRRRTLVQQALTILAKYGSAANLYLPGVGAINGITAGNWLDSIGTTAATVDNPVGLVVSAGKAVGPELMLNGKFDSGTAGWSGEIFPATLNSTAGEIVVVRNMVNGRAMAQISATVGKTYMVEGWIKKISGTTDAVLGVASNDYGGNIAVIGSTSSGSLTYFSAIMTATVPVFTVVVGGNGGVAGDSFGADNISVRELPGAHLTQTTTANKPILRQSSGVYAWDFVSSDSFTSTLTPGNAGFFCSSANVTDSGVLRTLLGAGAGSDASSGVWLARNASNALTLQVGNGTTRNSVSAAYPVATNSVASAGWDASNMFVGINGAETSGAKSVNCTSANTINVGVLTGTTNPMLGTISGGAIIMPTVLPTSIERATLRQFIASLSGVAL